MSNSATIREYRITPALGLLSPVQMLNAAKDKGLYKPQSTQQGVTLSNLRKQFR
ncbi:MAG: hypothetical protein M0R77_00225 [Gammaproteobacteria bacterium]|nr:hypothetical protein [Acholeplasmataceae bacterium]MCK9528980.1 hypothetical protein [Gammaproteobacteria bacterium]